MEIFMTMRILKNKLGMDFALIQPGKFMMGSPKNEPHQHGFEATQHEVTLTRAFYMQTTPVTQGQWQMVMRNKPKPFFSPQHPVTRVSWNDVQISTVMSF